MVDQDLTDANLIRFKAKALTRKDLMTGDALAANAAPTTVAVKREHEFLITLTNLVIDPSVTARNEIVAELKEI